MIQDHPALIGESFVVMSMDGIYKNGKPVALPSISLVSNDAVIQLARVRRDIVFGASVHPYRMQKEMVRETLLCIQEGASFFHWIPSAQQIDPDDERCVPFYITIAREGIPLVLHRGPLVMEQAAGLSCNRYNAPMKLKKALEIGVRVIIAHIMPGCESSVLSDEREYFNELIEMLRVSGTAAWDLYADMSVFCCRSRARYLERIRKEVAEGSISASRLTEGLRCLTSQFNPGTDGSASGLSGAFRSFLTFSDKEASPRLFLRGCGLSDMPLVPIRQLLRKRNDRHEDIQERRPGAAVLWP